ncbi:hypothetical protein CWATWH0402_4660 [Crocosphaera watsonii WH 0402]|uniref:Uncharacterized protein n=2 Tax=Crocosphaera watsonii TaxID=263511 RepID=T2K062_CROWT|nr:hypothetical protein [Crocosphaera watsonii]EHJ14643.1 hypothetical protein CWATWH0003_0691 [Crocosphaera watsonii WH 0003]CCQ70761.1 hypothetical protein CWATWH0402_4660 [Crocosphaera watsonii WH 0402]
MLEEYQGLINEISNTQQLLKNELKSALDDPPTPLAKGGYKTQGGQIITLG